MANESGTTEFAIPRELTEYILLGSGDGRRHIQDSPILLEVWDRYAAAPGSPADLLVTADENVTATVLAAEIYTRIRRPESADDPLEGDPGIAPLQNFVAARLYFGELLAIVVPMTSWWQNKATRDECQRFTAPGSAELRTAVAAAKVLREKWLAAGNVEDANTRTAFERFVAMCTLVVVAGLVPVMKAEEEDRGTPRGRIADAEDLDIENTVLGFLQTMTISTEPLAHRVSLNRSAATALTESVPTVKADAARRVFDVDCSGVRWAVLDTGIDTGHPAFAGRIVATYDFTNYHRVVTPSNEKPGVRKANLEILKKARVGDLPADADSKLEQIAQSVLDHRPVPWDLVEAVVRIDDPRPPVSAHGTHVAGILGARAYDGDTRSADGMCPDITLYDFRVLDGDAVGARDRTNTEFAIISALQFIRYLNDRADRIGICGVNMSLQIPHDVSGDACGLSPVCREAERLVDSGVVVVAAAGNFGWQEMVLGGQRVNDFPSFTIADPGNAERVITVGSTHPRAPLSRGISYFSSRGPTVDGRLKPDLVAPGEHINAPLPGAGWGLRDGTSMAVPHVSGAAAMLMARYRELIGKPDLIKRILCNTATDLGRERTFQGHGLVDVLRALQSQ
jgi:subtilisin family serine protease